MKSTILLIYKDILAFSFAQVVISGNRQKQRLLGLEKELSIPWVCRKTSFVGKTSIKKEKTLLQTF
jgi:hypothetical protein